MQRRAKIRLLTEHDRQSWASYAQLVKPLPGVTAPPAIEVEAPLAEPQIRPQATSPRPRRAVLAELEVGTAPGGVDRSTWTRFRTGKLAPVRTLDLHGRTVHRAHAELLGFIGRAVAEQLRCVEVITGRGSGETGGAIRREFPFWLNEPSLRPLILAASHPHPANPGAVRLLLRRAR